MNISDAEKYWRQMDLFDPTKTEVEATIIGCGGIGSFAAVALAKLGVKRIRLVDDDVVSLHNLPNQFFRAGDVGKLKVEALAGLLAAVCGDVEVEPQNRRFARGDSISGRGVVVSAVDSMEARKMIWASCKLNPRVTLFLDGRIGGELAYLYVVNPVDLGDVRRYEATLFDDKDAEEVPCTRRAVIYVGFAMGALMAIAVAKKHAKGNRELPFQTVLDLGTLNLMKFE